MQEAVLRAWAFRHRLKNEAVFGTWLTRIVINASRDMLKKRRTAALPASVSAPETPAALAELCALPEKLPPRSTWRFAEPGEWAAQAVLGWCLGAYRFTRFKPAKREPARLAPPPGTPM